MLFKLKSALEFKNVELLHYGETSDDRRRKRNDQRISNDLLVSVPEMRSPSILFEKSAITYDACISSFGL